MDIAIVLTTILCVDSVSLYARSNARYLSRSLVPLRKSASLTSCRTSAGCDVRFPRLFPWLSRCIAGSRQSRRVKLVLRKSRWAQAEQWREWRHSSHAGEPVALGRFKLRQIAVRTLAQALIFTSRDRPVQWEWAVIACGDTIYSFSDPFDRRVRVYWSNIRASLASSMTWSSLRWGVALKRRRIHWLKL